MKREAAHHPREMLPAATRARGIEVIGDAASDDLYELFAVVARELVDGHASSVAHTR